MSKRAIHPKPSFEEIVDAHAGEIHAFLWRMLQDGPDAEDCLQDSFLKAFLAYDRLDGSANYRAWLYTIAGNTARTRLRGRLRTGVLLREETEDSSPGVEDQIDTHLMLESVRDAVEALPYKQRVSLVLRRYQDLSYEEIAEILDTTGEAARANVYQATRKLRAQFEGAVENTGVAIQSPTGEARSRSL